MWIASLSTVAALFAALYAVNRRWEKRVEARFSPGGEHVTVDGVRLHYVRKGCGQPVVMLHGGILSTLDYSAVLDLAAANGYQGIAFDRPGYGFSQRPRALTPEAQARLIRNAVHQLGLNKPILVGHSWSGLLVLAYALQHQEELSGIVLLAPAAYGGKAYPAGPLDDALYHLSTAPVVGSLMNHTLLPVLGRKMAKPSVQMAFAPDPVPETYLEAAVSLWPRPVQLRANREDVFAFRPAAERLSRRYGEIRIPVVIVVGENDPFHPRMQAYRLHQELPHSRLIVRAKRGHMLPLVDPEAVVEAIRLAGQEAVRTDPAAPLTGF